MLQATSLLSAIKEHMDTEKKPRSLIKRLFDIEQSTTLENSTADYCAFQNDGNTLYNSIKKIYKKIEHNSSIKMRLSF